MLDLSRPIQTRNGSRVEIYRIARRFGRDGSRIIGAVFRGDKFDLAADWDAETGLYMADGEECCLDLLYADQAAEQEAA